MEKKPLRPAMLRAGNAGAGSRPCLITGCIVVVILGIVVIAVGFAGYFFGTRALSGLVAEWTDTEPLVFEPIVMSDEERTALQEHVTTFQEDLKAGRMTEPLVLSEHEANALLQSAPESTGQVDFGRVAFENGRIRGEVSLPLGKLNIPLLPTEGRYLNGSVILDVMVQSGRLRLAMDNIEVNGRILPESVMEQIRQSSVEDDIVRDINNDPEMSALLRNVQEIRIEEGQIVIVPKSPEA
jgi:hypothetical protein